MPITNPTFQKAVPTINTPGARTETRQRRAIDHTATPIPTGWHVIGRTDFANFVPDRDPPTRLREGDEISFVRAGS